MILIVPDAFAPDRNERHEFVGPLIDFLLKRYPDGFAPDAPSAIYVNNEKLSVDDYDYPVSADDVVAIFPRLPATGLEPWVIQLIIAVVFAAIDYVLTPKPKDKKTGRGGRVFDIGSGQNVPALGSVITEHFGKLWFFPDVASQPYVFYAANEQYVYQLLLIGAGEYHIDDLKFGNTPLALIPPGLVEYRLFLPSDHKSQYGVIQSEFNVYEDVITSVDVQGIEFSRNPLQSWAGKASANAALKGTEPPNEFKVGDSVTLVGVGGWAMHQDVKTITAINGLFMGFSSTIQDDHTYQVVKDDIGWRGWFAVCPVGKTVNRIDIDFSFPQGLFYINSEGGLKNWSVRLNIEVQQIDDAGVPIGAVIAQNTGATAATRDPIRTTFSIAVPQGRYQVRVRRETQDDMIQQTNSRCLWDGLKGYAVNTPGQYVYGDVSILALKMKASQALSSVSDRVSCLATRILPTVASDFTVKAPTVNPVDSFAAIVRESDPAGLDVPSLKLLGTRWAGTNGFNYRFDESATVYESLQTVAYSHRAVPQAYAKLLTMRPDDEKPLDQFIITEEHMLPDSFVCGIQIGPPTGLIDGARVEYQDPTSTTLRYVVWPTLALAPEDIILRGCTDSNTALAHAQYFWAKRQTSRRAIEFSTEWDALAYSVGDRISVLSNLIDNIRTCRVLSVSGSVLTVDAILTAPELQVRLRDQYGQPSALIPASMVGNQLTLSSLPPFPIFGIEAGQENTAIALGGPINFSRSYLVQSITPDSQTVRVTGASYSAAPYAYPIPGEVLT